MIEALLVTPQFLHHVLHFLAALCWSKLGITLSSKLHHIHLSKLLKGKGPTMQSRPKSNSTNNWINLKKKKKIKVSLKAKHT